MLVERDEINRGGSGTNAGSLHIQIRALEAAYSDEVLREMLPLKVAAARAWCELEADLGCDLGFLQRGGFMLAESETELDSVRATIEREKQFNLPVEMISQRELRALAPSLSHHVVGAAFCPLEGLANPLLVSLAYARRARAAGARLCPHTLVHQITPMSGGGFQVMTSNGIIVAARVLDAAGAWAGAVARMVGLDLNFVGKAIQVSVTDRRDPILQQLVCSIEGGITLKQVPAGNFLIGGGWPAAGDPSTGDIILDRTSIAGNAALGLRLLPCLGEALLLRSWAGPIAQAYDAEGHLLQVLGEAPGVPGFFVAGGGMLFTLGPLYARLVAELMVDGRASLPVTIHAPVRFMRSPAPGKVTSLTL
jgi:sarcosine oxidase subunit beta